MRLLLERSETRRGLFGRRIYQLTAGLDVDAAAAALIDRHDLGSVLVWVSPAALVHSDQAEGLLDRAAEQSRWRWLGIKASLVLNVRGLQRWREAGSEPSVTIDDLLAGAVLESWSVAELSTVEAGVRAGFEAVASHIAAVHRYDNADVDLVTPEGDDDVGVPPSGWVRMGRAR